MTPLNPCATALALLCSLLAAGQKPPPRLGDYPVPEIWREATAPLKIHSRPEQSFRTRLITASKQPPNFAGHYRVTIWGCGSECVSGAVIDLATGQVLAPPLGGGTAYFSVCQSAYEGSGVDYRLDSRLMIVRCGLNYIERLDKNVPDSYYFVLDDNHFRQVLHLHTSNK